MGLQELLKKSFFAILIGVMKMNAESLTLQMPHAFATCIFHTFCYNREQNKQKTKPFCFRRMDRHVFSFTAIRALLVIMQMRVSRKFNQTTNLILYEKLSGGWEFDGAVLDNKIILFIPPHPPTWTQSGSLGFEFAVV